MTLQTTFFLFASLSLFRCQVFPLLADWLLPGPPDGNRFFRILQSCSACPVVSSAIYPFAPTRYGLSQGKASMAWLFTSSCVHQLSTHLTDFLSFSSRVIWDECGMNLSSYHLNQSNCTFNIFFSVYKKKKKTKNKSTQKLKRKAGRQRKAHLLPISAVKLHFSISPSFLRFWLTAHFLVKLPIPNHSRRRTVSSARTIDIIIHCNKTNKKKMCPGKLWDFLW